MSDRMIYLMVQLVTKLAYVHVVEEATKSLDLFQPYHLLKSNLRFLLRCLGNTNFFTNHHKDESSLSDA